MPLPLERTWLHGGKCNGINGMQSCRLPRKALEAKKKK
jgi:hypothetical protein